MEMNGVGIDSALGGLLIQRPIEELKNFPAFNAFLDYLDELPICAVIFLRRDSGEKAAAEFKHLSKKRLRQSCAHFVK